MHIHTQLKINLETVFLCVQIHLVHVMFLLGVYLEMEFFIICVLFNVLSTCDPACFPSMRVPVVWGPWSAMVLFFSSALALTYQVGKMAWWMKAFAVCRPDHSLSWIPGTHGGNRDRPPKVVF